MASNGESELLKAVRALFITDSTLAAAGIFDGRPPREDELPYVLLGFKKMPPTVTLGGTGAWCRMLQVKVCAAATGNDSARAIAKPLLDAAYTLLTVTDHDGTPGEKLSALLVSDGFRAMEPVEAMELEPYTDLIATLERWHYGFYFDLRTARA